MPTPAVDLSIIDAFDGLSASQLAQIAARMRTRAITRGQILVAEGAVPNALYIVVSGRFAVETSASEAVVAEIRAGFPIGEIAFFAGGTRSATVRASRDSIVVELLRGEFDALCADHPELWRTITASLARRLRRATAYMPQRKDGPATTICVCVAGGGSLPSAFITHLESQLAASDRAIMLDASRAAARLPAGLTLQSDAATAWFNEFEGQYETLVFIADPELTPWTEKALRQADEVLLVARHVEARRGAPPLNRVERFARELHGSQAHRLVLLHRRRRPIRGTARWLGARDVRLHHHLVENEASDYAKLLRFLRGRAIGLVAGGGGALCAAQIGLYKALRESGVSFDIMGGTSGGAAMTAAFALEATPEQVDETLEQIFVTNKALKRLTWPRYSLLDHVVFDRELHVHYTDVAIEDLWIPFFAFTTNLSQHCAHLHRDGKLWFAVRASGSIPGMLPTVYNSVGDMLVDGGILDNIPLATMQALKDGPNVIIGFNPPAPVPHKVDYAALPSRWRLAWQVLNPFAAELPAAPSPAAVLTESLAAHRPKVENLIRSEDLLFFPPIPPGITMLDWQHHRELFIRSYEYGINALRQLRAEGHPFFDRI